MCQILCLYQKLNNLPEIRVMPPDYLSYPRLLNFSFYHMTSENRELTQKIANRVCARDVIKFLNPIL